MTVMFKRFVTYINTDEPLGGGAVYKRYYTTGEVARLLGVAPITVWRWIKEGKIRAIRTPGGWYRIPAEEVIRLMNGL